MLKRITAFNSLTLGMALFMVTAGGAYALNQITRDVPATVSVQVKVPDGLEIYLDGGLTQVANQIDFGDMEVDFFGTPTDQVVVTVWVQNLSNSRIQLTLDDDFELGDVEIAGTDQAPFLEPEQVLAIDLSLRLHQGQQGDFGFSVLFRAEDVPSWVSIGADHHYNGTIRFVHRANPGFLDVHYGASSTTVLLPSGPRFNQLLQYDPTSPKEIIGDLAESWEVSNDGLALTFHIAKANWQDGVPVTADDIVFSLDRMAEEGVTRGRVTAIRDFYQRGTATVVDARTVNMPLKFASATALGWLAVDYFKIYPRHIVQNKTQDELNCCFENNVGSGPWRFKEWIKGESWEYERNDDYFKNPIPFYDSQKVFIVEDAAMRLAAMKTGQVDAWAIMGGTTLADMLQVQQETDGRMHAAKSGAGSVRGFWFHWDKPPFDDPRVRMAVFLAIDRDEIMEITHAGEQIRGSYFPPGYAQTEEELLQVPGFRLDKTDDLVEAKRLMAEAGFPDGFQVTMNVDQSQQSRTEAELFAAQLKDKLGIDVVLEVVDRATFYQRLRDGNANMSTIGTGLYFLDPQVVLVQWFAQDTLRNPHNWENARFTELMTLEARETNQEVRREYFKEMAQILNKGDSHYIVWGWTGRAGAVDYRIQNFRPPYHPHTNWRWDQIWWDTDAKIPGPDAPPIE